MTSRLPFGPDESRRYTFGLSLEARLNEHVSLDLNPLYKRTGSRFGLVPGSNLFPFPFPPTEPVIVQNTGQVRSHSLELPVIGKYTFRPAGKSWRPFAGAGFAFQTAWQSIQNRIVLHDSSTNTNQTIDTTSNNRTAFDVGAVFSSGVRFQRGRIQFVPEMRFTRWGNPNLSHSRSQAEVLFTIRF